MHPVGMLSPLQPVPLWDIKLQRYIYSFLHSVNHWFVSLLLNVFRMQGTGQTPVSGLWHHKLNLSTCARNKNGKLQFMITVGIAFEYIRFVFVQYGTYLTKLNYFHFHSVLVRDEFWCRPMWTEALPAETVPSVAAVDRTIATLLI